MTPAFVHGSVTQVIAAPSVAADARLNSPQASAAKNLRSLSPATLEDRWGVDLLAIAARGGEHEARRRWQLHQQQNSPLSYTQKLGLLHYQADQQRSPLASLHIEI